MASENSSIKSTSSKVKTPSDGGKKVGFARPTLIIPPPQINATNSQYSANLMYTAGTAVTPDMYLGKSPKFMFHQFKDIKDFTMSTAKSGMGIGEKWSYWMYNKLKSWSRSWFTHFFLTLVIVLYTVGGAVTFIYIEGPNEGEFVDPDIRTDMYELIRVLTNISNTIPQEEHEEAWNQKATVELNNFKLKVIDYHQKMNFKEANRGTKLWTMMNAIVYCATVYTSIGYGHLYPSTNTGKAVTVVYALIGIPLFLIVLTDFGKLFTRCIKFLWSFVRRLYYTGSCKQVRKTAHVNEIFKGAQMMYEIATFRRPSAIMDPENPEIHQIPPPFPAVTNAPNQIVATPLGSMGASLDTDTPTTPALSNFEIDDEFNLPITVALFILISYIFVGALIYCMWEGWNFFASFYFVFISMSTIGFGDYVPKHPICMIVSIVYLVFGLALMSMCINVVQEKLSDTFKQASAKLGATIGFQMDEDGSIATVAPENVEMPGVHDSAVIDADSIKPTLNNIADKEKQS